MARKPRIHYDGALYHVLVRGTIVSISLEKRKIRKVIKALKRYLAF